MISLFIEARTGQVRTRKQVGSHIQVIKRKKIRNERVLKRRARIEKALEFVDSSCSLPIQETQTDLASPFSWVSMPTSGHLFLDISFLSPNSILTLPGEALIEEEFQKISEQLCFV